MSCPVCEETTGAFSVTFSRDDDRAFDVFKHECGATWLRGDDGQPLLVRLADRTDGDAP